MINETSDSPFPTSGASGVGDTSGMPGSMSGAMPGSMSSSGAAMADNAHGAVQRMAQKAHEAVDRLEQTLGSGSERMMDWQHEYGDMAREQVRSNPLAAVGVAFVVGILFNKLLMR